MTDRMEPTNRLRWVSRTTRAPDGLVEVWHPRVLQQLWEHRRAWPDGMPDEIVAQEWRDVPVVESEP
jgi:hypothetical protein